MTFRASLLTLSLLLSAALLPAQAVKASWVKPSKPGPALAASVPQRIISAALSYRGVPYVHAGDSRDGMDCSGLVYRVFYDTLGMSLSRGVEGLFRAAPEAEYPLHIGDLLFFDTTEKMPPRVPTHVGIYIGGGKIVHAASEGSKTGVIVSVVSDPYYRDRLIGVRRVVPWRAPVLPVILTDDASTTSEIEPFPARENVTIQVFNRMTGGGPVSFTLSKDGREVMTRWITPGGGKPAEVSFRTGEGHWSIHVSRIFKGRALADVSFGVVE
jgi:hypothetical protein